MTKQTKTLMMNWAMKTKLIYLTTDPNPGGGPRHILDLGKSVDQELYDVWVIAPKGWLLENIKYPISKIKNKEELLKVQSSKFKIQKVELEGETRREKISSIKKILEEIKAEGYPFSPIILHAQSPQAAYIASRAIKGLGIYLVYTEHLWTKDYHTSSQFRDVVQLAGLRRALKDSSKVIAVSKAVADFLRDHHIVRKEKVEVIYPILRQVHPTSLSELRGARSPKVVKSDESKSVRIGSVGALNRTKGYKYLVEAARVMNEKGVDFEMEIIGDGPERESLEAQIREYKLANRVKLIGQVKSAELKDYYKKWQIYTQPSLSETFGLAIFEALTNGLPIVATRVGAVPEQVENGGNGVLLKPADSMALAKTFMDLTADNRFRNQLAKNALKITSKDQFDPDKNIQMINNLYQEIVNYGKK